MSDALAHASYPRRNLKQLYCQSITYLCAIGALPTCPPNKICGDGDEHEPDADAPSSPAATTTARANATGSLSCCVPCAYKICNFDIALDYEFTKCIPNQRPEQCPRSSVLSYTNIQPDGDTMGYHRGMNVLTVGDGDFSFSLAIARLVIGGIGPNNDCHTSDGGMVVATSYENFNTLRKVYPDFEKTLDSLMCHGGNNVIVAYNVDATQLEKTLPEHLWRHSRLLNQKDVKFHRICWNFPCTAIECGQDGQNNAMEHNKELCRKFVANALPYLDGDCGEIHMAHKTKPPYNQWLLEKVALEAIADQYNITRKYGRDFEYKGRMVLDRCALLPYTPRKALDRRSFPCHDACIYVFGWRNDDASDREHPLSTIKAPCATSKESDSMPTNPSSIVPVTTNMVDNIRSIHINYLKRKPNDSANKRNGSKSKRRKKF